MSWKDDVKEDIEIKTGDGKIYKPLYKNPKMSVSYNSIAIEFNETEGAYVPRGKVSYRRYTILMYFQGDEHLSQSETFLKSCENVNPWEVKHPYYGRIICQPNSTDVSNVSDNVTQISIELWETIDISKKKTTEDKKSDVLKSEQETVDASVVVAEGMGLSATDAANADVTNDRFMKTVASAASTEKDRSEFAQVRTSVVLASASIGSEPAHYISSLSNLLRLPAKVYDNVENRIEVYKFLLEDLESAMTGLVNIDKKIYYETIGALIIGGICIAAVTSKDDIAKEQGIEANGEDLLFDTRKGVLDITDAVNQAYDIYMDKLSSLQSEVDNRLDSYYPDADLYSWTANTLYSATGNLFNISKTAKVERTMYVDRDIPLIKLVGVVYGNYKNETIARFIKVNNLQRDELIVIKKGRTIKYYV